MNMEITISGGFHIHFFLDVVANWQFALLFGQPLFIWDA